MPSAVCFRPAFWLALVGLRAPTGVGWELKLEDFEDDDCIESPESDLLLHLMHELGGVFEKVLLKSSGGIAKDSQDLAGGFCGRAPSALRRDTRRWSVESVSMDFDALEEAESAASSDLEPFLKAAKVRCLEELLGQQALRLPRCQLKGLPSSIGRLRDLRLLNLSANQLQCLPESFSKLESLRELELGDNQLRALDLENLDALRRLNVRNNCLGSLILPKSLEELDATGNCFERLPQLPSSLRTLWMAQNEVTELPDKLPCCLQGMQVAHNQLQALPDSLWDGHARSVMTHLDVSHNWLMKLPKTLAELSSLQSLCIEGNRIGSLNFGALPELRTLRAADNMIDHLPDTFSECLALQTLDLAGNPLVPAMRTTPQHRAWLQLALLQSVGSLSRCFLGPQEESLPSLAAHGRLSLEGRQLRTLPGSVCLLQLVQLDLARNRLEELPEKIGRLQNLRCLSILDNRMAALPHSLVELKSLERLDISGNQLQALPEDFGSLRSLMELVAVQNGIFRLPESFCALSQLRSANFTRNRLVSLPRHWGSLQQLEWLGLAGNELVHLPASFRALKRLTEVQLSGNPLASMLLEVEDLPEQRALWEMNQWGKLASIKIHAQQQGPIPECLVHWRWAPVDSSDAQEKQPPKPEKVDEGRVPKQPPPSSGAEAVVEHLRNQLESLDAAGAQKMLKQLFREWHPDKRQEAQKVMATRVFQWLQEVKVHYAPKN
ncbi:unnamed protein product [Durusdinium trenchii]|uniref:Uncharacterized protein n=1 Tax=Durusdinium trenchii TaxID=1381693 RepID=A0ABP0LRZ1_9DINO